MKKPVCTEENAIRFIYNLMNKAEQGEYQNHYASCTICSNFIHKIKTLKKITGRVKTPNLQAPVLREAISLPGASSFFHKFPVNLPALLVSIRADRNFSRAAVSVAAAAVLFFVFFTSPALNYIQQYIKKQFSMQNESVYNISNNLSLKNSNLSEDKTTGEFHQTVPHPVTGQWRIKTGGSFFSKPVIADGIVYFGSADGLVYAVDDASSSPVWKYSAGAHINSAPVIYKNLLLLTASDGYMHAVNRKTGNTEWKQQIGILVMSEILVSGEEIFTADSHGEIKAYYSDGKLKWSKHLHTPIYSSLSADNTAVFTGSFNGKIFALARDSGNIIWSFTAGSHFFGTQPLPAESQIIIGDTDGAIISFDKQSGKPLWWFRTEGRIESAPLFADKKIYFAADKLYCIDLQGRKLWHFNSGFSININLCMNKDSIIMTDKSGIFYSIHAQTGKIIGKSAPHNLVYAFNCSENFVYAGCSREIIKTYCNNKLN